MTLVQPTPEMRVSIRQELREPESVEAIEKDVAAIREWLDCQPHLPKDMDDARLRTFLRGCKFSLEKVKKKLDMYYTMRNAVPEFFSNRDINREELKLVLDYTFMPPLPGLTPNGRRVCCMSAIYHEFVASQIPDAIKVALMIGDIRLYEEQVGVAGDIYIVDGSVASDLSVTQIGEQLAKFSPAVVRKFAIAVQEAYPVKLKEIHIINIPPLIDRIMNSIMKNLVRPFVKEKILNRIHFHSDLESLYKHVPKAMLPSEYGGNAGSIRDLNEQWRKKLANYTPWFAEQEKSKANEGLRPGKPKTADDLFGVEGSFRQLTID